ncbi:hypothetical protein AVEN_149469-1, partial [Araneus ventricosus]
ERNTDQERNMDQQANIDEDLELIGDDVSYITLIQPVMFLLLIWIIFSGFNPGITRMLPPRRHSPRGSPGTKNRIGTAGPNFIFLYNMLKGTVCKIFYVVLINPHWLDVAGSGVTLDFRGRLRWGARPMLPFASTCCWFSGPYKALSQIGRLVAEWVVGIRRRSVNLEPVSPKPVVNAKIRQELAKGLDFHAFWIFIRRAGP